MNEDRWWPALHFGPVNLWVLTPAIMFYSSREEQERLVWGEPCRYRVPAAARRVNNPAFGRIIALIAQR